jgi:DnaK suppressor protein
MALTGRELLESISEPVFRPGLHPRTRSLYVSLWRELRRQKMLLRQTSVQGILSMSDQALLADLVDQAAAEQEQDFSVIVRERLRDKLRRVEQALERMEQQTYGLCTRCGEEIPFARLQVQPAAFCCVPCQSRLEAQSHPSTTSRELESRPRKQQRRDACNALDVEG